MTGSMVDERWEAGREEVSSSASSWERESGCETRRALVTGPGKRWKHAIERERKKMAEKNKGREKA